jgi:uncharacterized DUF497 family protein
MAPIPELLPHLTGFQWGAENSEKNWQTHGVVAGEIEQAFFNRPMIVSTMLRIHTTSLAISRWADRTRGGD